MNSSDKYLVIGNGVISNAIRQHLPNVTHIGRPGFDIRDDPLHDEIPHGPEPAIICAAIAKIATCEIYPAWTRSINVIATIELARTLQTKGHPVILLSSGAVKADRPTQYGEQKQELENWWVNNDFGPILRLPKVLHGNLPVVNDWMRLLAINHPLNPYRTAKIQPIGLRDVASAIEFVASRPKGLYEAAGQTVTWVTIARFLATYIGSESDIIPVYDGTEHPLLTKTKMEMLGWKSPTIESVIRQTFDEWRNNNGGPEGMGGPSELRFN